MEKEFVPYELAVKLKALGFDEPCLGFYNQEDRPNLGYCANGFQDDTTLEIKCTAPLYQQAFRWFREKYNLLHYIGWVFKKFYIVKVINLTNNNILPHSEIRFTTYEEAELACLKKLIEIIENK